MQKCWIQFFDGQIMFSQKVDNLNQFRNINFVDICFSPEYHWDPTRLHQFQWKLLPEWFWCEVLILHGIITSFLHFHEILPHCDSKHLFPFLLALVISHRKPRRFYTYTHDLLDCNIASHTFFRTQTDIETMDILDIVFTGKTTSVCCMVILYFLQLVVRE